MIEQISEEVLQQELDKLVEEALDERFDAIKDSIDIGFEWAKIWQAKNPGKAFKKIN